MLETRRAKECQKGIAGAAERAKEGGRVPFESSDTRWGEYFQTFESLTLDQMALNRVKKRYKAAEGSDFSSPLSANF